MKIAFTIITLCFISFFGGQAQNNDTLNIYKKASKIPKRFTKDPITLALKLTEDYSQDSEKVMAISFWIAKNIKYNYKAYATRSFHGMDSRGVLSRRMALCGEYSQLFKEMCETVGVQCEVVHGYTKDFDFFPEDTFYRGEHAWSVVKINGSWSLIDLTWTSSYITPRRQIIAKLLWTLFKRDYEKKFKAVRTFNPSWLYVPPERLIYNHMPLVDIFQMLSHPVSIEDFQKGGDVITTHLTNTKCREEENPELNIFRSKSDYDQWIYLSEKTLEFNPNNHRDAGYYSLLAADSTYRKLRQKNADVLQGSIKGIEKFKQQFSTADSLLELSILDNELEFLTYRKRSENWLHLTKKKNKDLKSQVKARYKLNSIQYKTVRKTSYKNKSHTRHAESSIRSLQNINISRTKRPKKTTQKDSTLNELHIYHHRLELDSLRSSMVIKDSIFSDFPKEERVLALLNEERIFELHKANYHSFNLWVNKKSIELPYVYYNSYAIDKPWFEDNLKHADKLNKSYTDSLILGLYINQNQTYGIMKEYKKAIKDELSRLKSVKKSSIHELNEDSLFRISKELSIANYKTYKSQVQNYLNDQKQVTKYLKADQTWLRKTEGKLRRDDLLEKRRHSHYKRYRSFIHKSEDNRCKYMRSRTKAMKKSYVKTFHYRSIELPESSD